MKKMISGRSMVEMIAVLAVIGILFIAAVMGMTYLKEKNTANRVMKEAITQAAEIKARKKQFVDNLGEIEYARKGDSLYISSRKYGSVGVGKTTLILSASVNNNDGTSLITPEICKKLVSSTPVGVFNCIVTDSERTDCQNVQENELDCTASDARVIFITDATTTVTGTTTGTQIGPCDKVDCKTATTGKVCVAGICQCPAGMIENENGVCDNCAAPEISCAVSDSWASNGCQIWKHRNCTPNDCNLKTGECCTDKKIYYKEISDCCLPDKWAETAEECCLDKETPSHGYCCPTGKEYFAEISDCCLPNKLASTEKKCCLDEETPSHGYCCPTGKEYFAEISDCCLPDKWASTEKKCCLDEETPSHGYCCPTGQEYFAEISDCCLPDKWAATAKKCCDENEMVIEGYCEKICSSYTDCASGYFCDKSKQTTSCNEPKGVCRKAATKIAWTGFEYLTYSGKTTASENGAMDWWSAQDFCKSLGLTPASAANSCKSNWKKAGISVCPGFNSESTGTSVDYWLTETKTNSCNAYDVSFNQDIVARIPLYASKDEDETDVYALCEGTCETGKVFKNGRCECSWIAPKNFDATTCECLPGYTQTQTSTGEYVCWPYCENNDSGLFLLIDTSGSMTDRDRSKNWIVLENFDATTCECMEGYHKTQTSTGEYVCWPYCENNDSGLFLLIDTSGSMSENNRSKNMNTSLNSFSIPLEGNTALYSNEVGKCGPDAASSVILLPYGKHTAEEFSLWFRDNANMHCGDGNGTYFTGSLSEVSKYCKNNAKIVVVWWTDAVLEQTSTLGSTLKTMSQNCDLKLFFLTPSGNGANFIENNLTSDKYNFLTFDSTEVTTSVNEAISTQIGCIPTGEKPSTVDADYSSKNYICNKMYDNNPPRHMIKDQCDICPSNKVFWSNKTTKGVCYTCNRSDALASPQTECNRCSNRFWSTNEYCYNCSSTSDPETSEAECKRCPSRFWIGGKCYDTKPDAVASTSAQCLTSGFFWSSSTEKCYNCERSDKAKAASTECHRCSNRFWSSDGYCYNCSSSGKPATSVAECNRCSNRKMSDGKCIKK